MGLRDAGMKKGLFFQSGYLANLANSRGGLARLVGLIGDRKLVATVATVASSR